MIAMQVMRPRVIQVSCLQICTIYCVVPNRERNDDWG
jgi:hypothetical protein